MLQNPLTKHADVSCNVTVM